MPAAIGSGCGRCSGHRLLQGKVPGSCCLRGHAGGPRSLRIAVLVYNDYETTPKFYGPVQYTVRNLSGNVEVQGTVALTGNESTTALTGHVDETDADPITAMDLGTVAKLSTQIYNESGGTVNESRRYFLVPSSGAGTAGT